jgi:hypothetical protein
VIGVQPREQAPQGGTVHRATLQAQPGWRAGTDIASPLTDRGEPSRPGRYRAYRHSDQGPHRMPHTPPTARVGYPSEQLDEQPLIRDRRAYRCSNARRWHGEGAVPWSDGLV